MGTLVTFPFVGGLETGTDKTTLADGKLADAQNVEMDRLGRLRVRARFVAQPTTAFQGGNAFVAYDLFSLNDRLFAFGDSDGFGFPTDFFEYFPTGLAAAWKPTSVHNSSSPRLPRATKARELAQPPNSPGGVSSMGCTAFAGYAALGWNSQDVLTNGYVQVVRAADNQPVVYQQLSGAVGTNPVALVRLVGLSDRLIVVGVSTNGLAVSTARWIPATDKVIVQLTASLITSGSAIDTIAVCKVAGADQFVIVAHLGGTLRIRRYDNTGTVIVPSGGQYADISATARQIAVEASSTANALTVLYAGNPGPVGVVRTYNLSTGATVLSAGVPWTTDLISALTLTRLGSRVRLLGTTTSTSPVPTTRANDLTGNNTLGGVYDWAADATINSSAQDLTVDGDTFMAFRQGANGIGGGPNMILLGGALSIVPQMAKDLELSGVPSVTPPQHSLLPELSKDASTGKFYWCNAVASPDGALTPFITEFVMNDTGRRQMSQLGNLAYVAGACPVVFDGAMGVESGFLARPRILSLTPSNSTGALLGLVTYDYRVHAEWVDADDRLHVSPPSVITSVTLGAADNTVTAVVATHHSLRLNFGSDSTGSEVRYVLSRTLGSKATTAATTTGTAALDVPPATLNGETLLVSYYENGTLSSLSAIFVLADLATLTTLIAKINSSSIGTKITASNGGGVLKLTANLVGSAASFIILSGSTGAFDLGLTTDVSFAGSTTLTKGQNFQRAAAGFTQPQAQTVPTGQPLSIVDTRKDESSPIVDSDLIRQAVLYSQGVDSGAHHAPLPNEYTWASRDRVVNAGLTRRSIVQASKTLVTAEPAEFAFEGFEAFLSALKGDVQGVALLGDAIAVWTRREIWLISGSGPNRSGQGEFFAPVRVSGSGGLIEDGWRSLVETDEGIFFQLAGDKIYLLGRAGTLTWVGREAQDYLEQFPVVTAAIHSIKKHSVIFSITNTAGNAGGLLRFDLENKAWFFDDVGAVSALAELVDQVAFVQAGVVYLQDASPGSGTFVSYRVKSGMFQGFGQAGRGLLNKVGFIGTYHGDCTVEAFISYDGVSFATSLGQFSITSAEYSVGQRVIRMWDPTIQATDQFALLYVVTGTSGSEGVWLHSHAFDVSRSPEMSRQGANKNL